MEEFFNTGGDDAEKYERLMGQVVRIFYQDMRGTDRTLIGKITEIDGDDMWLENFTERGLWRGCLNCRNARICIVSTVEGWSAIETK